jgi:hypothetical protein
MLPNTSVTDAVIDGIVPTAVADGTATATLYAGPAVPFTNTIVEYEPLVTVTDPTAVPVVKAYTVSAVPAEVAEIDVTPAAAVTGAATVAKATTSFTPPVATNETTVPVSAVAAIATASAASTELSAGTVAVAGASAVVALVTPATATDSGAALAEVARVVAAKSDATTIDSFFMFVFYSSSYDLVLCVDITHLTIVPKFWPIVKFSLAIYCQ